MRSGLNQVIRFDDGPTNDSTYATTSQGLNLNGDPCLLEIRVMGFCLCNAKTTFARLLTNILDPCIHLFVIVYLDDICI